MYPTKVFRTRGRCWTIRILLRVECGRVVRRAGSCEVVGTAVEWDFQLARGVLGNLTGFVRVCLGCFGG